MNSDSQQFTRSLEHAAVTDVGMRRSNNQDSYSVAVAEDIEVWKERGHLFLVADGMGAHAAGELASRLAAESIPHLYHKHRDISPPDALKRAVEESNAKIHRTGEANAEFHNMGTTCSVLALLPQGAIVAHVGDSRIYRLRRDSFEQLTFDHSLVWEMRATGQVTEGSELAASLPKNVITRSLGPNLNVKVDVEGPFPIEAGDIFLLCSDGLSGQVEDVEMGLLLGNLPAAEAAQVLADLANLRGGPDNVTCIVAKAVGGAIVSAQAEAAQARPGLRKEALAAVNPLLWVALGICLLTALGLMFFDWRVGLAAAGVGAALAAYIGYVVYGKSAAGFVLGQGQRFGKGPYVTVRCQGGGPLARRLLDLLDEVREGAQEQDGEIDEGPLDELLQSAQSAAERKKFREAAAGYARALAYLSAEIRALRDKRKASDSSVNL